MFMVAASVVTTILVLNYHHRQADTHEMPEWVWVKNISNGQISLSYYLYIFIRSSWYFCNTFLGSWGCQGRGRRSPGRQSWCRRRWKKWSRRRYPPSRCWRTFLTLMTTWDTELVEEVTPTIPATWSLHCPTGARWWGECGRDQVRLILRVVLFPALPAVSSQRRRLSLTILYTGNYASSSRRSRSSRTRSGTTRSPGRWRVTGSLRPWCWTGCVWWPTPPSPSWRPWRCWALPPTCLSRSVWWLWLSWLASRCDSYTQDISQTTRT